MSQMLINRATDLLPRYMWMGNWCANKIAKKGRGKSESTKRPRIYSVSAPASGWPGGNPNDNGLKGRKS